MDKEFLTKALLAEFQHCESLDLITAGEESSAVDSEFFECVDNAYGRLDIDKLIDDYGLDTITDKYPEFGEMCRQHLKEVEEDSEIGERDLTKEGTKGADEEAEEPPLASDDESPPISLKDDVEKRIVEGEHTGKNSFNNQVREEDGYVKELIEDQQTKPSVVSAPQFGMFQGDDAFVDVGYKGFASGNQILIRNGAKRKTFTLLGDNTIAINGKRFPIHKNDDGSVFAGWKSVQNTNGKIQIEGQTLTLSEDKKEVSGLWKAFPNQKVFVFPADMRKGKYVANLVEQTGRQPYESPESVNSPENYDTAGSSNYSGESQFFQNPIIGGAAGAAAGAAGAEKAAGASSNNTIYTGHKDRYGEDKTSASQNGAGASGYTPNWTYGNKTERDAKAAKERAKEEAKRRGEKSTFGNGAGKDGVRFTGASFYTKQRVENITAARGMRGTLQDQGKLMRSAFARKNMAQARRVSLSADDYKVLSQNYYQILHINTNNAKALKNDITLKTRYLSRETKNELKEARRELSKFGLTDNYLKLKEKLERGEFLGDQKRAAEKYLKAQEKANEEVIRKGFFDSKNKGKLEVGGFAASLKLLEENKRLSVPKTKKELEEKIKKMENSKMGLSKTDESIMRAIFALNEGEKTAKKAKNITRAISGKATGALGAAAGKAQGKSKQYASSNQTAQGLSLVLGPVLGAVGLLRTALRTGKKAKATINKTLRTIEQGKRTAAAAGKAASAAGKVIAKGAQKVARQGIKKTAKVAARSVARSVRRTREKITAKAVRKALTKTVKKVVKLVLRIIKAIVSIILVLGLPALIVIAVVAMLVYMVQAALNGKSDFKYNPGEQQTSDVIQGYVDILTECTNRFNEELEKRYGSGVAGQDGQAILSFCEKVNNLVKESDAKGFTWEYHNGTIKKSKAKPGQNRFKTTSYEEALENFQKGKQSNVNCSMLPTWALRNAGIVGAKEGVDNCHPPGAAHSRIRWGDEVVAEIKQKAEINEYGGQKTVKELVESGEITPGDIIGYDNYQHLNIYAGDENFYDSGSAFTKPVHVDPGASWAMVHEGYLFKRGMYGRKPSFYTADVGWVIHFTGNSGGGTDASGSGATASASTDATGYASRTDPADGFPEISEGTTVPISPAWGITSGTWANWEHSWEWWAGLDRGSPRINRSSNQYRLYEYMKNNGHTVAKASDSALPLKGAFAVVDQKYYLVAATEFWGDIGDIFQIQFSSGQSILCIQADAKNYVETGYKQGEKYGLYGGHLGSGRDLVEFFFFGPDGRAPSDVSPGINNQSGLGTPVSVKNCGNFMKGASASDSSTPRSMDASVVFVQDVNQGVYRKLLKQEYMPSSATPTPAKSKDEQLDEILVNGNDYVEDTDDTPNNIYMFKDTTDEFPYGISPTPVPKKEKDEEKKALKSGKKLAKFEFYNNNQEIISMVEAMLDYNVSKSTSLAYIIYNDGSDSNGKDASGSDKPDKIHKQNTDMVTEDEAMLVQWLKLYGVDMTQYTKGSYESLVDNLLVALFDSSHLVTETKVITYHDKGMTYEQPARDADGNLVLDEDGDTVMETVTVPCPGHASTSAAVISIYFDDLFDLKGWWDSHIYKVDNFNKLNPKYDRDMKKATLKSGFQLIIKPKVERHLNESCERTQSSMDAGVFTSSQITKQQSKENRQKTFDFLVSECDLSPAQAIGVCGNIARECGFNPQALQPNGVGYGLIQWSYGRRTRLVSWCNQHGYAYDTLEGQLEYLKANELGAANEGWSNGSISKFKQIDDAEYAAEYFARFNEQPGDIETEVGIRRANAAKYWRALTTYGANWSSMVD